VLRRVARPDVELAGFDAAASIERVLGDRLTSDDDAPRRALEIGLRRPLSILTGGPGTGKTTLVARLVRLLALPYAVPLVPPELFDVYCGLACEGALLLVAVASFQVRGDRVLDRAERRFCSLVTASLALWLAQKLVAFLPTLPSSPWLVLLEDALLVGFYACLAVAVLLRPDAGDAAPALAPRRALDLAGTLLFTVTLLAYFSWVPFLHNPRLFMSYVPSMALVLVLDLLLVARFAWARRHTPSPRWRAVYGLLLATALLWFATDFVETLMLAKVVVEVPSGTPLDFLWWLPLLGLIAAGRVREHPFEPLALDQGRAASGASFEADGAWGDALVGYAAAFPLLHFVLYTTGLLDPSTRAARETLALIALVALAGLAVAYQKILLAENRRLNAIRLRAVQAEHRAYHDALTGLPNRYLLFDRLEVALARARRAGGRLAVLFLDLDRFKVVNDTLGHSVGDRLLREVAERLSRHVRKGDTLARLGGDEFTLLLETAPHPEDAVKVARNLREVLREPFALDGRDLYVTTSTGIALHPEDGADVESLLKGSDVAMYRAKQQGGDGFQLYQPEMNARAEERLSLESSLRKALGLGQFALRIVQVAVFEDEHRIGVLKSCPQHPASIFHGRRREDLKPRDMRIQTFQTMRVLGRKLTSCARGHPYHHGNVELSAGHVQIGCSCVQDLVQGEKAEVHRHDFDDWPHAAQRSADTGAHKPRFRQRRVANSFRPKLIHQSLADGIASAIGADVLPHEKHTLVFEERFANPLTDGFTIGHPAHAGLRSE
jgi:diguanylate cyclase (GGDEF)-like protein